MVKIQTGRKVTVKIDKKDTEIDEVIDAKCSRCGTLLRRGTGKSGEPVLKCPSCGWIMVPPLSRIVEGEMIA